MSCASIYGALRASFETNEVATGYRYLLIFAFWSDANPVFPPAHMHYIRKYV